MKWRVKNKMFKKNNLALRIDLPIFPDKNFNIIEYGALGNGLFMNTDAIANAINVCSSSGGGKVIIPPGLWLTGPIYLKNNVDLHIEKGAIVVFSKDLNDYPLILSNYQGYETARCTSPIMGLGLENIAITGLGIFDGNGNAWRPVKKSKLTEMQWSNLIKSGGVIEEKASPTWWPTKKALEGRDYDKKMNEKCTNIAESQNYHDFFRPVLMSLVGCKKVLLDGPTFQNSPAWCLHPRLCEHMTIRNIKVRNLWFAQNGDGIDIESCKYVALSSSTFDVGDDAICIKSGKNEEGRKLNKPTEYVSVKDCTVYHGHGGVVIGSEMSGGVKDIEISQCNFIGTDTGLRFKSCRGRGGIVKNIYIDTINMKDIQKEAITFSTSYNMNAKSLEESLPPDIPEFRDFHIGNINCNGAKVGIHLSGLPEMPIRNINFENILMKAEKDIESENTKDISMKNISILNS